MDYEEDFTISRKRKRPASNAGRCSKQASKRTYTNKRKNIGKKKDTTTPKPPVSLKKVKHIKKIPIKELNASCQGYRLIDLCILQDVFAGLNCPECVEQGTLFIDEVHEKQKGLASNLVLLCGECDYKNDFYTSKTVEKCSAKQGVNPFEINVRAVYGMKAIGAEHASLEKVCGFFNMPKPMTAKNFSRISNNLRDAAKVVAERSMSVAVKEIRDLRNVDETSTMDIGVSVDGTW